MREIYHSLVLNLHQPAGNLQNILETNEWEARQILWALDRIPRSLWPYESLARVHLSLSGTLLETLQDPEFQRRVYGFVDCGSLLWHLQNEKIIQILGTAYYHSVLPLIPPGDREEQTLRWLGIGRHLFWRPSFQGFWPPEMGFTMEMIPLLRYLGYRYVLVDSANVEPVTPLRWEELRYRPHIARHGGAEIVVVVRDRELSDAQESGMDFGWFYNELHQRTKYCDFPPLVTTCSDGDNGGWFRNTSSKGNFWGVFYREFMEQVRSGWVSARPVFIPEYLDRFGAHGEVRVHSAAWNTGWHDGQNFLQWTGSHAQRDALHRVHLTSKAVHDLRWKAGELHMTDPSVGAELENTFWHLLRAETSCNLFWGEAWVSKCHADLDEAWNHLNRARERLSYYSA